MGFVDGELVIADEVLTPIHHDSGQKTNGSQAQPTFI